MDVEAVGSGEVGGTMDQDAFTTTGTWGSPCRVLVYNSVHLDPIESVY